MSILAQTPFNNSNTSANGGEVPNGIPPMQDQEISIREILEVLLKGKWIILITFVIVAALVTVYSFLTPSEYETTSLIRIEKEGAGNGIEDMLSFGSANRDINNEMEMLKSRSLMKRVAGILLNNKTKVGESSPLIKQSSSGQVNERVVAARLKENIKVKQVNPDVDIIELRYTSTSPYEAQYVTNTYVEEYVNWRLEASRKSVSSAKQFLEQQYGSLDESLRSSEQNLKSFLESRNVVQLDQEATQLVQQATNTRVEWDKTRVDLEVAQAQLNSLQRQIESNSPGLSNKVSSTAEQEIGQLKQRIAELQTKREIKLAQVMQDEEWRTKPNQFPEIQNINNELTLLTRRLEQTANRWLQESSAILTGPTSSNDPTGVKENLGYINTLRRQALEKEIEISGLRARQGVIDGRLNEYEGKLNSMPGTSVELAQLQRDRASKEKLYEYITEKLQEARAAETATVGGIQIVDPADYPLLPVRPNRPLNLLIGALLGLALGIGIVFVRNALDDVIRKPEDLRKRGFNVLGVVPSMERVIRTDFKGKDKIVFENQTISTSLLTLLNPLSPVSESYRRLRVNVEYSRIDSAIQTLLVSSPAPGDGKTVTAFNLAVAMAQSGRKTLYVDADLRRPTGHKMIERPKDPGLVELLFEVQSFHPSDFYSGIEDLYIIPAGSTVPNPAELLASKKMRDFILQLRNEFDIIIFDTPPILAVSDAVLMMGQVDAAMLVISAGETRWQGVERSVEQLQTIGSRMVGIVMNRFDSRQAYGYYSYYNAYDGYYYSYYGYGDTSGKKAS